MRFDTARADRVTAVLLFALGAAMLIGGFTMDRLEIRQIHPASIPGLVPMVLGAALALCAILLFSGARDRAGEQGPETSVVEDSVSWPNLFVAALFSAVFALILVGRVPFFVSTAAFITVFVGYFSWPRGEGRNRKIRAVLFALVFGVAASAAISLLFRYGFLVRLP